jgi:epoxyqueuosine reductase
MPETHAGTIRCRDRGRLGRLDPAACAGVSFSHRDELAWVRPPTTTGGRVSAARGRDCHDVIRPTWSGSGVHRRRRAAASRAEAAVDSSAVLERDLAAGPVSAGSAEHESLAPALGSYFFIGIVLTTALPVDQREADRCGTCRPVSTPVRPGRSSHTVRRAPFLVSTIRHRGDITGELGSDRQWLFGCDVCRTMCPWNRR